MTKQAKVITIYIYNMKFQYFPKMHSKLVDMRRIGGPLTRYTVLSWLNKRIEIHTTKKP